MRTLQVGLRVSDLYRSLAFYTAVGYTVVGTVEGTGFGSLTMLRLPGDSFESLNELVAGLAAQGIAAEPPALPAGPDGPRTTWIELVQWSAGHADGITEADFP